jgi:hypothetical protein
MPLKIAFIAWNAESTRRYLQQLVEDNADQVAGYNKTFARVFLRDQTEIIGITNLDRLTGQRFDQVIVADDWRRNVYDYMLYNGQLRRSLSGSVIPEEYQYQIYDLDEERPK